MIESTLKIARYCSLVIQGFSNFLGLFQGIMANPELWNHLYKQSKVQIGDWHLVLGHFMYGTTDPAQAISGIPIHTHMVWMESLGPEGISKPQEKWRLWEWSFRPDTLIGIDLILKHKIKRQCTKRYQNTHYVVATQIFFIFTPTRGNALIWLIFFRWVETTNQLTAFQDHWDWFGKSCPRSPCLDSFRISLHLRWF